MSFTVEYLFYIGDLIVASIENWPIFNVIIVISGVTKFWFQECDNKNSVHAFCS